MASGRLLQLLTAAVPRLARLLPRLWPLLLEQRNRERLREIARALASQSPKRRLQGRIELTATLAEEIAAAAEGEPERAIATGWAKRARNLSFRAEMPKADRQARHAHRAEIEADLEEIQADMNSKLGRVDATVEWVSHDPHELD